MVSRLEKVLVTTGIVAAIGVLALLTMGCSGTTFFSGKFFNKTKTPPIIEACELDGNHTPVAIIKIREN